MAEESDLQAVAPEEAQISAQIEEPKDAPPPVEGSDASDDSPESLASELGWCPKDEWRGDPDEWKPASAFLRNTVDINKRLSRDLKATREASERAARAAASITERAVEAERSRLLAERQQAFDAGDGQAFNNVERQLASLPTQAPAQSGETQQFIERNASWYGKNKEASELAYAKCEELARLGVPMAQQLVLAEQTVRQAYPELFRQATKGPAQVDTGQPRATSTLRKGPKGYNDLPPDAKKAADDFARRGRATKDEYAKLYWQENA